MRFAIKMLILLATIFCLTSCRDNAVMSYLPSGELCMIENPKSVRQKIVRDKIKLTPDLKSILDLCLKDMLANDQVKSVFISYGSENYPFINLKVGPDFDWPKDYSLKVGTTKFIRLPLDYKHPENAPHFPSLEIREIILNHRTASLEFCVANDSGKHTIGGCTLYYEAVKTSDSWSVNFKGAEDP